MNLEINERLLESALKSIVFNNGFLLFFLSCKIVIKNLYKLIHSSTLNKLKVYQTYLYRLCPIGTLKSPDAINYLNVLSKTSKVMCFQLQCLNTT
jgi:hypothetical protein